MPLPQISRREGRVGTSTEGGVTGPQGVASEEQAEAGKRGGAASGVRPEPFLGESCQVTPASVLGPPWAPPSSTKTLDAVHIEGKPERPWHEGLQIPRRCLLCTGWRRQPDCRDTETRVEMHKVGPSGRRHRDRQTRGQRDAERWQLKHTATCMEE